MKKIVINERTFKVSDNEIFMIEQNKDSKSNLDIILYIKKDKIEEVKNQDKNYFDNFLKELNNLNSDKNTILVNYKRFTAKSEFHIRGKQNDCLKHAERVSLLDPNYNKNACVFSAESSKNRSQKFGVCDTKISQIRNHTRNHIASAKNNPMYNHEVNPNIGDAFAMVPYKIPKDKDICPYHAAIVLFKDGNTNITSEADAGKSMKSPVFDMYSTDNFEFSFYTSHITCF